MSGHCNRFSTYVQIARVERLQTLQYIALIALSRSLVSQDVREKAEASGRKGAKEITRRPDETDEVHPRAPQHRARARSGPRARRLVSLQWEEGTAPSLTAAPRRL